MRDGKAPHPVAKLSRPTAALAEDKWELYTSWKTSARRTTCSRGTPGEARRTSRTSSWKEAIKYNVLPLDDRTSYERFNAAIAGRPDLMGDRTRSLTLYPGMTRIMENAFINVKNQLEDDHR